MSTLADVTEKALALSSEDRLSLAMRMWESLEHFTDLETEKVWLDEARKRWKEIEEGKVQCLNADQVLMQARDSLLR